MIFVSETVYRSLTTKLNSFKKCHADCISMWIRTDMLSGYKNLIMKSEVTLQLYIVLREGHRSFFFTIPSCQSQRSTFPCPDNAKHIQKTWLIVTNWYFSVCTHLNYQQCSLFAYINKALLYLEMYLNIRFTSPIQTLWYTNTTYHRHCWLKCT